MARLDDGFSTRITFSEASGVAVYEKAVTPPGMSAGGEIDTTTMQNTALRTKAPKSLVTMTPGGATVAYDAAALSDIYAMMGTNQQITITYPDATQEVFWGWIDEFNQNEMVEGEQPTAEMVIIPSNQNAAGAEAAPTLPT